MSRNVYSRGYMFPLMRPVADVDELSELLWEKESTLHLNYEGTLVYTDSDEEDGYGLTISKLDVEKEDFKALKQEAREFGLDIMTSMAQPYTCHWYNGTDSYMAMLSLEEYCERAGYDYETWFGKNK